MKVLVVEDDRKIKTETIDDCLASLGYESDWAQSQQEANGFLAANDYDLILQDLQIPSRPGGKALPEFGKNLLKQSRARKGRDVPVILMTAQHQDCVDLLTELQEIGIDGSISKPFPSSGRTLAVVISDVVEKYRRFRVGANGKVRKDALTPFEGGVLAYYPDRIDLCGEGIVERSGRGLGWQILQVLRKTNDHGSHVHRSSRALARELDPEPEQNTLIRAICSLRSRVSRIIHTRLGRDCRREDVIANDDRGYHLHDSIIVEVYDEEGAQVGKSDAVGKTIPEAGQPAVPLQLLGKHRWVMSELATGRKLTRRDFEQQFSVSERTAKRYLGELVDAGMVEFDRSEHPGYYRLKS